MVRKYHWYDLVLVRKMRIVLTILVWIVWLLIAFLQQDRIRYIINLLLDSKN